MKIDLERIRELQAEIEKINSVPFAELELYEDGQKIEITAKQLDDFRFIGMSNFGLLEMWPIDFDASVV
jgi:hypothetical protein